MKKNVEQRIAARAAGSLAVKKTTLRDLDAQNGRAVRGGTKLVDPVDPITHTVVRTATTSQIDCSYRP